MQTRTTALIIYSKISRNTHKYYDGRSFVSQSFVLSTGSAVGPISQRLKYWRLTSDISVGEGNDTIQIISAVIVYRSHDIFSVVRCSAGFLKLGTADPTP